MSLSQQEVVRIFSDTGALLEGHFIYTSGRHGEQFLQAARVLQYPGHTSKLCAALAEPFADDGIQLVVGPATGGIILAYETARHLKCRAVFTEKDGDGGQALKRGFALEPGTRTLVVEDVVTTGGSVAKTVAHMQARGAEVVAVAVLIDRSGGSAHFDCAYRPLAELDMKSWTPEECPLCAQNVPLIEPDDIVL
ncbi:MAG: orotate phosphoribosyltransferase [Candidatus Hydrogenedentes bacterium]|nr:orotate phosphoribosyltransferase [Candidatus Hydrogenedentota bacterium]